MKLSKPKTTLFWKWLQTEVPRLIPPDLFTELNFENSIVHVIDFTFVRITMLLVKKYE